MIIINFQSLLLKFQMNSTVVLLKWTHVEISTESQLRYTGDLSWDQLEKNVRNFKTVITVLSQVFLIFFSLEINEKIMRKKLKIFLQSYKVWNYIDSINIYMYSCIRRKKVPKVKKTRWIRIWNQNSFIILNDSFRLFLDACILNLPNYAGILCIKYKK